MINPRDYFEYALKFHGHKCPAMPLGLKMASVAMNELNVEHAHAGELFTIVDLGEHHCAGCIADGVQVITGCTFGKGNIIRSMKGKFSLTLIDQKNSRGVKITPIGYMLQKAFNSEFMEERKKGNPPHKISAEITDPLIEKVFTMPIEKQFKIEQLEKIKAYVPPHKWDKLLCEDCGELTVAEYGFYINRKFLCADCAEMTSGVNDTNRSIQLVKE